MTMGHLKFYISSENVKFLPVIRSSYEGGEGSIVYGKTTFVNLLWNYFPLVSRRYSHGTQFPSQHIYSTVEVLLKFAEKNNNKSQQTSNNGIFTPSAFGRKIVFRISYAFSRFV